MENLGYKEGSTKPKLRHKISRAANIAVDNNLTPLTILSSSKTTPTGSSIRYADPEAMLEAVYPSEGFEYMEVGPSPPAESAPNMYEILEEPAADLGVHICADTIRMNLLDQMISSNGRVKLLEDIEQANIIESNLAEAFGPDATQNEKNICLLWSAFLKRWDLLEIILEQGAELQCSDLNGISALHLSVFSGCLTCTSFLISKNFDIDLQTKAYTPLHCAAFGNRPETAKMLLSNGANIDIDTAKQNCEESLLHCAVRANAVECVKLFVDEGADVNSLKPNGTNPIHLAADLGYSKCLDALLTSPTANPNIRICIREKESTALHLAADEGNLECVSLLLAKGADAKLKNHRGFTALHLAARTSSLECVESLLRDGNADPNALDFDQRTPLHSAIGKSDSAYDILETLIAWGANVNHKDTYGFTALHLAALDSSSQCVETLIFHGADVSTKSNKGTSVLNVIARKTPGSLAMINQKLDAAITARYSQDVANREIELELDFRQIIQYCHPKEMNYLNTFVEEGQKEILQHPLCSAFLYIKWGKIRKFYIARLIFCFFFILFLSLYVLTALAHNCYNSSKEQTIEEQELCQKQSMLGDMLRNNPFVMEMQWWVLVGITIFEIFRKLYGISGYSSVRRYIRQVENTIEWFIILSVFIISYVYTNRTYTFQNHIGAFAVLVGWTNLMLMIGQLPVFGTYIAMYTKVQAEFGKLFAAYSCMLVGFAISFCVIFPTNSSFANPFVGFITVLVMMVGEQDLGLLANDPDGQDPPFLLEISAQIVFILFLLFVTVILMNLLVGIAVHDIQGLKKTADLSKLVRQTKLISYIETALFNGYLPKWLKNLLHFTALVSPQAYRAVLSVRPLNPGENRLPRHIMMAAYEIAKQRKHLGHIISTSNSNETSFMGRPKFDDSTPNNISLSCANRSNSSPDIDYNFDNSKENPDRIDEMINEIRELKVALLQNRQVVDQFLVAMSNQTKNKLNNSYVVRK